MVISDLHVSDPALVKSESWIAPDGDESDHRNHPLAGLDQLIKSESLNCDVLLCPGDVGHKSYKAGINYGWRWLQTLGVSLGAGLLATAGNHDLQTTGRRPSPTAALRALRPRFPTADDAFCNEYWGRHFAVIQMAKFRLVLLNTCANQVDATSSTQGKVDAATLNELEDVLRAMPPADVNILLCHHHPLRYGDIDLLDYSEMNGGHLLLERLGSGKIGQWLVIHGHKHWPHVVYATGGATSATVFGAGSASAVLYPELATKVRNQVYLIEIPLDVVATAGLVGVFRSWEWSSATGWRIARGGNGLPPKGGFGSRIEINVALDAITREVVSAPSPFLDWEQLVAKLPWLRYVLPNDIDAICDQLEADRGIRVLSYAGSPAFVTKP